MMSQRITTRHLHRLACLYVRQSPRQPVCENTESTARQYALRERAVALGWPPERIMVTDQDSGHSGASAADRAGFQRLVAEVGLGKVGLVLGLEVSRLARSSSDWHRLLEICALTGTLILDEDGLYDPATFNDRLLLGLKGTMSEAELYVLRARLQGGILNKARRAALKLHVPVGFRYAEDDRIILDPDRQVQDTIRFLFRTFQRTGSASATVRAFRRDRVPFPRRVRRGPHHGALVWGTPSITMCCRSSTTPVMRGRLSSAAPARPKRWMVRPLSRRYPVRSGRWSSARPTLAIPLGGCMGGSWPNWPPIVRRIRRRAGAPHGRARPCCEGWCRVAAAGSG